MSYSPIETKESLLERKLNKEKNLLNKKVYQYDLNLNLIKIFDTIEDVKSTLNLKSKALKYYIERHNSYEGFTSLKKK